MLMYMLLAIICGLRLWFGCCSWSPLALLRRSSFKWTEQPRSVSWSSTVNVFGLNYCNCTILMSIHDGWRWICLSKLTSARFRNNRVAVFRLCVGFKRTLKHLAEIKITLSSPGSPLEGLAWLHISWWKKGQLDLNVHVCGYSLDCWKTWKTSDVPDALKFGTF